MSFGLRNAAQCFQRFMDEILKDLDFCFTYIDDILVFSHSPPKNTTNTSAPYLHILKNPASFWTRPSVFSVFPKSHSSATKSNPWDRNLFQNVSQNSKPALLPRPSANSDVSWECSVSTGVSSRMQPPSKPLFTTSSPVPKSTDRTLSPGLTHSL